jgi:signal transduction histidine kinase
LLTNAIKFTPSKGKVIVSAVQANDFTEINIIDSGVGISTENLAKLFKFESHFSTQGTNRELGTGLGLLVVKELVEKNDGRLVIKSEVGKGTTCSIILPSVMEQNLARNSFMVEN